MAAELEVRSESRRVRYTASSRSSYYRAIEDASYTALASASSTDATRSLPRNDTTYNHGLAATYRSDDTRSRRTDTAILV